ncbi:MAG: alpha/beta fold hydrolase [Acidimicrobiaceae bacterium]|nr:alpha/beta fold hydrolase [Acidimicrobiaceae bacterium]
MIASLHAATTGAGPAVVLVHGMGDSGSVWAGTVEALGGDFACTAVDLPGHGRSPAPPEKAPYERDAVLASIDAVLDRTGPAVYVGHSLGGYLGLTHCLTRPGVIRGLVLVAAGPGFRDPAAMKDWNDRVHLSAPRLDIPRVATTTSLHTDSMVIDRLTEVAVPVGLLVGSNDKAFVGANDYMERNLPDVRRRTVDDGRHRLMRTHPGAVAGMVRDVAAAAGLTPGR